MDEYSTSALQYGHLGKAAYLPDSRSWAFSRTLAQPSLVSQVGIAKTTIRPPFSNPHSSTPEDRIPLPSLHPDLAACWSSVNDDGLSRVITAANERCDPRVSSLFDLGHAVDLEKDDSGYGVVPIAVSAAGESRNRISFRKVEEDTVELTPLKREAPVRLRIPSVGDAENTEWSAGTASVRQISFARTIDEPATWVVVRFPQSTIVFRPLYSQSRIPMHIDRGDGYAPQTTLHNSHIEPNPLIEISSLHTGGLAHADITFNPWYPKQLGIVDEGGNWSVWEFSGRYRRNKGDWSAACIRSGSLPWIDLHDNREIDGRVRHDGWAAIEWTGDVNSFVVADRRCLMLYRMESGRIRAYPVELGMERKSEWILDIRRSQSDVSCIFILTSARILWLDVSPVTLSPNDREPTVTLSPRLSWYHFRDPEDTTLRLGSLLANQDLYLFLYSRLNRLVLGFQCCIPSEDRAGMAQISDPFILDVPMADDVPSSSQVSAPVTQFSTFVLKEIAFHSPTGRVQSDISVRILKLFAFDSSLSLCESVYVGAVGESSVEEQPPGGEAVWSKKHRPGRQAARFANDFVVDDWDESILGLNTVAASHPFMATAPLVLPHWAVDFKSIYDIAIGKMAAASKKASPQGTEKSFVASMKQLDGMITSAGLMARGTISTTLELLGKSPLLDDIDQDARELHRLSSAPAPETTVPQNRQSLVILPQSLSSFLSASSVRSAVSAPKLDLVDTYDGLVDDWLCGLPHHIPGRTRIMKEKAVRNVSVDIALARINVFSISDASKGTPLEEQTGSLRDPEPSGVANGIEPSETIASELSGLDTDRGLSTAGISNSPKHSTAMTRSMSDSQFSERDEARSYTSLASLTTFNSELPMSGNVTTMLSHWQPGTNPATYVWQLTVQEQVSESEMSRPSSRGGSQKRSSQGRAFDSQTPPAMPPVYPAVRTWGSQPDDAGGPMKVESSQVIDDDLPMTQTERGMFGGREASRKSVIKARKKRAAGF